MSNPELPNPDTYLNHLSPADAREFEIGRNVTLAVLAVCHFPTTTLEHLLTLAKATVWDILVYIPEDTQIVRRSRFRLVIFCFLFSRYLSQIQHVTGSHLN